MRKLAAFLLFFALPVSVMGASVDIDAPKTITADKIEYDVKSETIKRVFR